MSPNLRPDSELVVALRTKLYNIWRDEVFNHDIKVNKKRSISFDVVINLTKSIFVCKISTVIKQE